MPDSTLVLQLESPVTARPETWRLPLVIAIASCASLLLELALTRLFSVVLFYHFAFLAISVALLGLGAGGVFAYVFRVRLSRFSLEQLGSGLLAGNALLILGVLEVVLHTRVSLDVELRNFESLAFTYLVTAVPFFLTGLLFSIVFARESSEISRLYGFDLIGGALACLVLVPLLNRLGAPNAVLCAAVLMALAARLMSSAGKFQWLSTTLVVGYVALIAANHSGRLLDIMHAKGSRRDSSWVEFARWNALSRVEVDQVGAAKYIVIDADASTAIMNVDPALWDRDVAVGSDPTTWKQASPFNWKADLMNAAPAVANVLRPRGDFAIIGPGGGVDVLRALANGSRNVTAIEINPIIANDIMRGRYADYAYHLYQRPEVHLHVQDGRSFIRNSKDKYDVIEMTLVDTWASTAAGAFALSENNLYTVEAFKEYFDHLKPDGMIAITRWEFKEPREALRVVSQGIEALREMGTNDARANFIVVSEGALDTDGRPVLVLAKKSAFTTEEISHYRDFIFASGKLRELYSPLYRQDHDELMPEDLFMKRPDEEAFAAFIGSGSSPAWSARAILTAKYPYNVAPVHDNAPFFFFTFKTSRLIDQLLHPAGQGIDWKVNLGVA